MSKYCSDCDNETHTQGVHDGQQAGLLDQFCHNLVKNYTLSPHDNDIYNAGYEYGLDHQDDDD